MGGIRSNKRSRCSQLGFTMVELMVAVAISAVILVGIGAGLRAMLVSSANSTNHALAMSEVQKGASWIGDDVVQAQNLSLGDYSNGGFPLIISWTTPQPGNVTYNVTYTVGNMTDKLGRNLWALYRTTNNETATVAQRLKPFDPTNPSGTTSCSPLRSTTTGALENVLVMNVASQVDAYSASASYQISPRAFNFTWGGPYTLTYTAGANGFLLGNTSQTVDYGGNGTEVTAYPDNSTYFFVRWSDGLMTPSRTDINVKGNIWVTAVFGSNTYTITASAGSGGNITPSGAVVVNYGDSRTFNISPNAVAHYHVADVLVDGESVGNVTSYTFTNVTDNHDIFASFALDTNTISTTAGAHGTITPANPAVNYGASQTFSITPNTGYHTVDVIVDSTNHLGAVTSYTFTNVTAAHTIAATFAINTYTLTYTAGSHGSISGTSPQTVNYGGSGTAVTAVPATNYHFINWSDSLTSNPRTDTNVTGNISVTANFAIDTYTLTYAAGLHGSISGTSPQTVSYGGNGTAVTAVPATGYHFVNWSDGPTANPRTDTNVTGNISVTASFAINTYTLTYAAGLHGSITGTSPQTVNYGGSGTAVTAVPATGYHFVNWSDSSTSNPRTDTNVTGNISVTANFAINTYTLTYTAGSHGSISGITPQTVNYGGNGTAVTAMGQGSHHFVNWSDGSTANPRTDTNVTVNINVTANFN